MDRLAQVGALIVIGMIVASELLEHSAQHPYNFGKIGVIGANMLYVIWLLQRRRSNTK